MHVGRLIITIITLILFLLKMLIHAYVIIMIAVFERYLRVYAMPRAMRADYATPI